MITILNQKYIRRRGIRGVYIGRPHKEFGRQGSPLANEFHVGRDGTREEVIEKYRRWLLGEFRNKLSAAYRELERLADIAERGDLAIICWCKEPGREVGCHGDVVKRAVEYLLRQREAAKLAAAPPDNSPEEPGNGGAPDVPLALVASAASRPAHAPAPRA